MAGNNLIKRMSEETTKPEETSKTLTTRAPISFGERGLRFLDMDQMFRFSKAVSASQFCPKGWSEIDCFVALQKGAEVGMSPMQSLESIYVVNNRATLFGDAPKALVEASGLMTDYKQTYEGKEGTDDYRCVVTSTRKGRQPMTETYSVRDARTAQLWDKPGPWKLHPRRMLLFRARGFNLRDNFGDVLKGFQIGELVDEDGIAGFEHAKLARVVEPNFERDEAVSEQTPAKRVRSRSRSREVTSEPKEPDGAPESQEPVAPSTERQEPRTSLFDPERPPVQVLAAKLAAAGISPEVFLEVMRRQGALQAEPDAEEISSGRFGLGSCSLIDLRLALDNWESVLRFARAYPNEPN
jgi:hypothetical protein